MFARSKNKTVNIKNLIKDAKTFDLGVDLVPEGWDRDQMYAAWADQKANPDYTPIVIENTTWGAAKEDLQFIIINNFPGMKPYRHQDLSESSKSSTTDYSKARRFKSQFA